MGYFNTPHTFYEASKLYFEHKSLSIFGIFITPLNSVRVIFIIRIPKYIPDLARYRGKLDKYDGFNIDIVYKYKYRSLLVTKEYHNVSLYNIISDVFRFKKEVQKSFLSIKPIHKINWRMYEAPKIKFYDNSTNKYIVQKYDRYTI